MADGEKKPKKLPTRRPTNRPKNNDASVEIDDEPPANAPEKKSARKMTVRATSHYSPETVAACTEFVKWAKEMGVERLGAHFREQLSKEKPPTKPAPSFEANATKNRYQDVICLEETRVKLTEENPGDSSYIHANYVNFKGHDRKYIATQAPMEHTVEDFWRMITGEQAMIIVNLCSDKEKAAAVDYWPQKMGEIKTIGRFTLILKKKEEKSDRLFLYLLEVMREGCSESHIVRLIHSTAWPDGGVTEHCTDVLRIIKLIFAVDKLAKSPIVIHCSAGIGRTGTMLLVDYTLYRLFIQRKSADLIGSFLQLRENRASSVQKDSQWVQIIVCVSLYIYKALKDPTLAEWAKELERNFKEKYIAK